MTSPLSSQTSAPIVGVDLLPRSCREALAGRRRKRVWAMVCGLYGAMVAISWLASPGPAPTLASELARANALTVVRERELETVRGEVRELARSVGLAQAVGDHPNWSRLLSLVARARGEKVVLSRIAVESVAAGATDRAQARSNEGLPRPGYEVSLAGTGVNQASVSEFVLGLERLGLFDSVTLVETRARATSDGVQGVVEFSLRCRLVERERPQEAGR